MEQRVTEEKREQSSGGCFIRILVGLTLLLALLGFGVYWAGREAASRIAPTQETVLRATPTVITSMRDLAVLETSSFHIERVVDLRSKQSALFGLIESEDAILLVAAGDVRAGVDLSDLREEDVQVDAAAHTVKLRLPPAKVLSATLDNDATYVHTRQTDVLAQRHEQLESDARREAERTIREAALAGGILPRAQANAERTLRVLLHSLGYTSVTFTFRAE